MPKLALLVAAIALAVPVSGQIANIVVTSAVTYERGMPAPGSIATAFCTGLKGITGVVSASGTPLPLELAGVRVMIGDVRAPLFSVSELGGYQQINLQLPWESGLSRAITIEQGIEKGSAVTPHSLTMGEFFQQADGSGVFLHGDYSLVTSNAPARAGEVVVGYFTGLYVRPTPPIPTGYPNPPGQPSWEGTLIHGTQHRLWKIQVGDDPNRRYVDALYLGPAPGLVGIQQVNFSIPEEFGTSRQPVSLVQYRCITIIGGGCFQVIPEEFSQRVLIAVQ